MYNVYIGIGFIKYSGNIEKALHYSEMDKRIIVVKTLGGKCYGMVKIL